MPRRVASILEQVDELLIDELMPLLRIESMKELIVVGTGPDYHHLEGKFEDNVDYHLQLQGEKEDTEKLVSKYISSKGLSVRFTFQRELPGEVQLPVLDSGH